jgi:tripartite-type tricarboxylate transporter receptor subunit TctC
MKRKELFSKVLLQHSALVLLAWPLVALAQATYPMKPIRFISPFAPGGSTSAMARLVGQKLTESWGQNVIVDNRPGGNTIIGTDALAKSRPGQLNYATTGAGGSGHLANEMLNILAGIKTQHIPYKGAGPALVDLIGGQVQMFINNPLTVIPHIKSGRLKAMAITGETRVPALPQVPTFTEAGLPGLDVKPWFFVLAPAGTPKAIIDKLSTEIARIVAMPDVQEYLAKQGMDPFSSTPEQLATLMKTDMAKWAKVIKTANIKLEN